MRTYRCKRCKRKFKITRQEVNTRRVNIDNNSGYRIVCPFCYSCDKISFEKLPKRVKSILSQKSIISKKWLD